MGLQFRIYPAEGSGQSGAGGPASSVPTNILFPTDIEMPYKGDGVRYVYRKYFLSITNYTDSDSAPLITGVNLTSLTSTGVVLSWYTNENTTTELDYGTTTSYGSSIASGTSLASGLRTVPLGGLSNNTVYFYKISATDSDSLTTQYNGSFNTLDAIAPNFIGVTAGAISSSGAIVSWTTDEPATTRLKFGTGSFTGLTANQAALTLSHVVSLNNLDAGTTYNYRVIGIDGSNNSGESSTYSFSTATTTGFPPLTITSVASGSISNTGASITWTTNNLSDTRVIYSTLLSGLFGSTPLSGSTGVPSSSYINSSLVTSHSAELTGLAAGQTYWYKAVSNDIFNQIASSPTGQTGYFFNTIDTVPPTISFSGTVINETNAIVGFVTNELATGSLIYDTQLWFNQSGYLRETVLDVTALTGHSLTMTGLVGVTSYVYKILATDLGGNTRTGILRQLTTIDATAPVISNISSGLTPSAIIVNWQTDEAATSVLRYGTTPAYEIGSKTGNAGGYVFNHSTRLNNLTNSTLYYYQIQSVDLYGNTGTAPGLATTLATTTGDTTAPVISNINVAPGTNDAIITWDTDELSSTLVEYTTTTFPGTGATGLSGTNGIDQHVVNISPLPSGTLVYYNITSEDAALNSLSITGQSFTTQANLSNSNFFPGDTVCTVEWFVPEGIGGTFQYPIRVCVPVQDAFDLTLPWATEVGFTVQRDTIKQDGNANPKIVEIVFPVAYNFEPAGTRMTTRILAAANATEYGWEQYEIPSDLKLTITMPNGSLAEASLILPDNGIYEQVRGDGNSSYMRTFKIFTRAAVNTVSAYHPELKSLCVHSYITVYNKNVFPDYYPQIDVRISNAWMNESAPAYRGAIYYQSASINFPTNQPDGIQYGVTVDLAQRAMSEESNKLILVKQMSQMPANPHPNGDVNVWLGGSQSIYNLLYANDTSNHAFIQGYAIEYRLALFNLASWGQTQTRAKCFANLDFVGYVIEDGSYTARSWSNCRSFGPLNVFCPTLTSSYDRGAGQTGRVGFDNLCESSYNTIRANLTNGTYYADGIGLAGAGPGNFAADNPYPVEYGPYRPCGPGDGGEPGGFQITPFDGFNHSKYALLWKKEDHKMKLSRHPHHMYSVNPLYNADGKPSSIDRWASVWSAPNSTMLNGFNTIPGTIPFNLTLDRNIPYFDKYVENVFVPELGYTTTSGMRPWNAPTVPVTVNHVVGEGCSYNDDRASYAPYWGGDSNGRFHLIDQYGCIDHAHQIRYVSNLIACSEMLNDVMMKDDLMMQADINMLSYGHYPTSNTSYANGYNLAEHYYGYNRGLYQNPGIIANSHQGVDFGRAKAWPLFAIVAAHLVGNASFRDRATDNILLWSKIYQDAVLPIGSITRQFNPTLLIQHAGLFHNGAPLYLNTATSSYLGAYRSASLEVPSSLLSITTTVQASEGYKLVAQWVTSKLTDGSQDSNSPYSVSLTLNQGLGLILKKDSWLDGWKANIFGGITSQTGSNTARYKLQFYLRSDVTGTEVPIFDEATAYGPVFSSVGPNKHSWTVKQVNPANGQVDTSFAIPFDGLGYNRIVVKLYISTSSVLPAGITTYFGTNGSVDNLSTVFCTLQNLYGCVYDHAQVFETNMMQMAAYAAVQNVTQYLDAPATFQVLASIREYYNAFYNLTPIDFTLPGAVSHSSSWLYFIGSNGLRQGAESWVMSVAYNKNYPPGGLSSPFTFMQQGEGFYSHDPDATQYAPWSSFIGMLAEESLNFPFTTTLSTTVYNPGFLMHKWCQMGTPHNGAGAAEQHAQAIENRSATTYDGPLYVTNAAGCIGHIRWRENNPNIGFSTLPVPRVPNIKVFIGNESRPLRAKIAATPFREDAIRGASVIDGSQTGLAWVEGNTDLPPLEFKRAHGLSEAVTLYNNDGELGGHINVSNSVSEAIPFWVQYRLDENTVAQTGWISLNVVAGEGPMGGAIVGTPPPIPVEINPFVDFNLSGDANIHLGSELQASRVISKVGNVFSLTYDDGLDPRQYVIDFSPNSGNDIGLSRVYETYSNSWPVWNGGLEFTRTNGSVLSPTAVAPFCANTLAVRRQNSFAVIAEYLDTIDGAQYRKRYTYTLSGKALRVHYESSDVGIGRYSGNYTKADIGIMSGVTSPVAVEFEGLGSIPITMGLNGTLSYYIGNFNDLTQSNAQDYFISHPVSTYTPGPAFGTTGTRVSHSYRISYKLNTTGGIVAPVDETWSVIVADKVKDCFITNTAPDSPYYEKAASQYYLLLGLDVENGPTQWVNSSTSYYNLFVAMTGWGMENMAIYPFYWWSADSSLTAQSIGPNWFPAKTPGEFLIAAQFAVAQPNWCFGPYTIFGTAEPSSPYYSSGYVAIDQTGGHKLLVDRPDSDRNMVYNYIAEMAKDETNVLVNNYGINAIFHDVNTYNFKADRDKLDQRATGNNVKTIREGLIYQKQAFNNMRAKVNGPLWGEGALVPHDSDMQYLYFGYVDSTERVICTNTGVPIDLLPSGSLRSPTRYWSVPDYEWFVTKERQPNHGLSFDARFFNASDYDIAAVQTGGFQQGDLYPYTTGCLDRYRAFSIMNARAGFKGTNGYVDGLPYNTITHEQLVQDYYIMNAVQSKIYGSPCTRITYIVPGVTNDFSGTFDDIFKQTRNVQVFTGASIHVELEDQTHIYCTTMAGAEVDFGSAQFSMDSDSFLVYNLTDNFWAFKTNAVIGGLGDSDGNDIVYVNYPGKYEAFHGRGTSCTSFGSVNTTGNNRSQFKVLNYAKNITIESYTGINTQPYLVVYTGLRP